MTSDWSLQNETGAMPSSFDLKQIKEAVRDLRAANPRSALADLVDEKIRMMERHQAVSLFEVSAQQTQWISH